MYVKNVRKNVRTFLLNKRTERFFPVNRLTKWLQSEV